MVTHPATDPVRPGLTWSLAVKGSPHAPPKPEKRFSEISLRHVYCFLMCNYLIKNNMLIQDSNIFFKKKDYMSTMRPSCTIYPSLYMHCITLNIFLLIHNSLQTLLIVAI